ncbi:hypothetical protein [Plantactinospora sp. WMMB782]|uniref:hypothetical protein n=1 Tax=Plantactinospora sp. WMMB782 TaxID=3404121 RepID=UPI003B95212A
MKQEVKRKWVAALRSGEFAQGEGALRRTTPSGDRYCCLGVLCEVAVRAGVIEQSQPNDHGFHYYGVASAVLPPSVVEWAGLDSTIPSVGAPAAPLTIHNDSGQFTFAELADLIERDL